MPEAWTLVAESTSLPEGKLLTVDVGETPVLLVRYEGVVRAYEDTCTHLDFPLSTGCLDRGELICPWHGAAFAADNGVVTAGPAEDPLTRYAVQETDGRVYVDLTRRP